MTNSSPEKKFHANLTDLLTSICASTTELWFLSRPMVHITAWVSLCCSISRHVRCPGLTLTPPIPKACIKRLKIMSYCSRIICHLYYDSLYFFFFISRRPPRAVPIRQSSAGHQNTNSSPLLWQANRPASLGETRKRMLYSTPSASGMDVLTPRVNVKPRRGGSMDQEHELIAQYSQSLRRQQSLTPVGLSSWVIKEMIIKFVAFPVTF